MNHFFNPTQKETRIRALLYILSGILIFVLNSSLLTIAVRIIGVLLLIAGAMLLYSYFKERTSTDAGPLFAGLPALLIGLLMIFSPESVISVLPVLAGIIIALHAIMQLQKAFLLKDYGFSNWKAAAGIAVAALVLGLVLFIRPLQSVGFIMQIIGCALIFEGIVEFGFDRTVRKARKQYRDHE